MQSNTNTGGTPNPAKPEVHPAAELFPPIEGAEFEELVADIRANGLRTPILLDAEGRVLDGRNRLRACREAGVEPRFETWDGKGSALEVVVSMNLRRRHLNESQRAMLAAQIKEKLDKGAPANWPNVEATEKAALLMNISPRSVRRAAKILRSGDRKLISRVQTGDVAVSAAAKKLAEKPAPAPAAASFKGRPPILYAAPPRWDPETVVLQLAPLRVSDRAAWDAVLFLRAPDHALEDAIRLIAGWGFVYRASLILRRPAHSGRYTRSQHELVLIAARGSPPAPAVTLASLAAGRPALGRIIDQMFPGLPRADVLQVCGKRPV